jgi:hypothetical protein
MSELEKDKVIEQMNKVIESLLDRIVYLEKEIKEGCEILLSMMPDTKRESQKHDRMQIN